MPEAPINLNLARIVHRLLTDPRGWEIESLQKDLDIAQRTYRKYREVLLSQFEPLRGTDGRSRIREVKESGERFLRLMQQTSPVEETEGLSRMVALFFARHMLTWIGQSGYAQAIQSMLTELQTRLPEGHQILSHLLENADRLFCYIPHGDKDYSRHGEILREVIQALLLRQTLQIDYTPVHKPRAWYEIQPLSLFFHRGGLYIHGFAQPHGQLRMFAVERIHSARRLTQTFEYPAVEHYDPIANQQTRFGIFDAGEASADIRVELVFQATPLIQRDLRDRVWHPSQQLETLADGRIHMAFRVSSLAEVRPWVNSWGKAVEIVAPPPDSVLWRDTTGD
jgi:proteasome accessory factor B